MKLVEELKAGAKLAIMLPVVALIAVPFMIYKLVTRPFEKPLQLTTQEVAVFLRKCIDGSAEEDELDYFTSVEIEDSRLNEILRKVGALFGPGWPIDEPPSPDTSKALGELLEQVEAMLESATT